MKKGEERRGKEKGRGPEDLVVGGERFSKWRSREQRLAGWMHGWGGQVSRGAGWWCGRFVASRLASQSESPAGLCALLQTDPHTWDGMGSGCKLVVKL